MTSWGCWILIGFGVQHFSLKLKKEFKKKEEKLAPKFLKISLR